MHPWWWSWIRWAQISIRSQLHRCHLSTYWAMSKTDTDWILCISQYGTYFILFSGAANAKAHVNLVFWVWNFGNKDQNWDSRGTALQAHDECWDWWSHLHLWWWHCVCCPWHSAAGVYSKEEVQFHLTSYGEGICCNGWESDSPCTHSSKTANVATKVMPAGVKRDDLTSISLCDLGKVSDLAWEFHPWRVWVFWGFLV